MSTITMGLAGWLILTALTIDCSSGQTYSHSFSSNIGSLSPNFLFTSPQTASNSSDQLQSSSRSSQRSEQARLLRSGFFRPSLFHVVTFPNDECFDVSNQSGTCYTAAECRAYGGTGTASCAKGYGTCCIISRSCHNTTSQKVVYFKNPSYPQSDSHQNYCDLTIEVKDASVCQIRLDLLDLQLDSPTDGDCMGDKFTVSATGMATNSIPTLCGLNRNQHFYINLPQNNGQDRSVSLLLMTNSNGAYRWHIRATQIRCVSPADVNVNRQQRQLFGFGPQAELKVSLPAPPGCLQYFTTKTGVIQSFNFGQYLNNLDYAICIERLSETCRVSFTTAPGDWSIARTDGVNNQLSAMGDAQCAFDYLMIPAASRTGFGRTYDRFCGGALNYRENRDTSAPIVTRANGPIVLRFRTSQRTGLENRAGFRLRYEQSDVGCQLDQVDGFIDSELDDLGGVDGGLINPVSASVTGSIGPMGSMASNSYPSSGSYPQNYPIPGQKSRANAKRMKL